jgi:pimeloyl-ACP methyl ester carboxylesterase
MMHNDSADPDDIKMISCPHENGTHAIEVLIWRSKAPQHQQTPVLCVHGLTRNAWDFAYAAKILSRTRDVYALSMAGRGASAWLSDARLYNYSTYITDCMVAMQQLGLQKVDWLGTSMGGLMGMLLAAAPATPIRRMVLNDVGPFIDLAALQRIGQYVARMPQFISMSDAERHCRAIYADFGITGDAAWRFFTEHSVRALPDNIHYTLHYDPAIAQAFNSISADVDLWPAYDAIQCRILLLRGIRSDVLTAATAHEMTIRGPCAQLITFDDCGHAPALMNEVQVAVVDRFFAE